MNNKQTEILAKDRILGNNKILNKIIILVSENPLSISCPIVVTAPFCCLQLICYDLNFMLSSLFEILVLVAFLLFGCCWNLSISLVLIFLLLSLAGYPLKNVDPCGLTLNCSFGILCVDFAFIMFGGSC